MSLDLVNVKFFRYLLVGMLNTSVGFAVFSLVIYLSKGQLELSLAANIGVGVFFNYLSYGFIVFKNMGWLQFLKFVLSYSFIYLVNLLILKTMQNFNFNIYVSQFFNVLYLAPLSYYIFSRFVFVEGGID